MKAVSMLQNKYFAADALAIDHDRKVVTCNNGTSDCNFEVMYDKLAIATGSQGSTFGIPGEPCKALQQLVYPHALNLCHACCALTCLIAAAHPHI